MTKYNLHKIFHNPRGSTSYMDQLEISNTDRSQLMEARKEVRECLKFAFKSYNKFINSDELLNKNLDNVILKEYRNDSSMIEMNPKFLTQGSFAYNTLNKPSRVPPQQIDIDDGMYLPVKFFENQKPLIASDAYFKIVERALENLVEKNGWQLDKTKSSCVRVEISTKAHIDIPLYSVSQSEFSRIKEEMFNKFGYGEAKIHLLNELNRRDGVGIIKSDQVMLAHREEKWMPSDPRKLHDWFLNELELHGEVYRRVCRYLKGWRDNLEDKSELSSIAIMKCVADVFNALEKPLDNNRDDIALYEVSKRLPDLFSTNIENPLPNIQEPLNSWSGDEIKTQKYKNMALNLSEALYIALENHNGKNKSLEALQSQFGNKIPQIPSSISFEEPTIEQQVLENDAVTTPLPKVPNTMSG